MNDHIATSRLGHEPAASLRDEIDNLLLHIKGLVLVRNLLLRRGASEAELEEHSAEIGRLQWRLARHVKQAHGDGLSPDRREPDAAEHAA